MATISEILLKATENKFSDFTPVVIELHERGGQKINVYFCKDTQIKMHEVRDRPIQGKDEDAWDPIVRVMNRSKAYFIRESLEELYNKLFPAIKELR